MNNQKNISLVKLLSRDDFREGVFVRDNHRCVNCGGDGQDAHHIIERRLFSDGGYYIDNGVTLCGECHILAEETTLSCDDIREKAGIEVLVLPDHFYFDINYDKWGNIILPNGNRVKGELFYDESVQKILKQGPNYDLFTEYIKYPRTYHLPWSNLLKDDRMLPNDDPFIGQRVIGTLKMDGENTTMYPNHIHARSIDSSNHQSRVAVKNIWAQMKHLLDEGMRICGENLYAKHSIGYDNLPSHFMVFSMWDNNTCLSWDETLENAEIFNLATVPTFYDGIYDPEAIKEAFSEHENEHEGYVIRLAGEFEYGAFRESIAKYVRPEFREMLNNSHGHWISKKIEPNLVTNNQKKYL